MKFHDEQRDLLPSDAPVSPHDRRARSATPRAKLAFATGFLTQTAP